MTASTTAASAKNAIEKWLKKNSIAYVGDNAFRISGWSAIPLMPQTAMAVNHTIITGPNRRPTVAVPSR